MKLLDLDATFLSDYSDGRLHHHPTLDGAQGVMFVCPLCQGHCVLLWFSNPINAVLVPNDALPKPRWTASGTGLNDLTLTPSVNLDTESAREAITKGLNSCLWHGWVKNGDAA